MKIVSNLFVGLIVVSAFYALGFYGSRLMWSIVEWVGIDNFAIFAGIVAAIQGLGVLVNARVER